MGEQSKSPKSLVSEFEEAGHLIIDGTATQKSYLVVAKNARQKAVLGIRPLIEFMMVPDGKGGSKHVLFVGIRVRADRSDAISEGVDVAELKSLSKAFDGFKYEKVDEHRCSTVIGMMFDRAPNEAKHAMQDLEMSRYWTKLTEMLHEKVNEGLVCVDEDDIKKWMKDTYMSTMEFYIKHYTPEEQKKIIKENHEKTLEAVDEFFGKAENQIVDDYEYKPPVSDDLDTTDSLFDKLAMQIAEKESETESKPAFGVVAGTDVDGAEPNDPADSDDSPQTSEHAPSLTVVEDEGTETDHKDS